MLYNPFLRVMASSVTSFDVESGAVMNASGPTTINNATAFAFADFQRFSKVLFLVTLGNLPTGATVTGKVQMDDASGFPSPVDVVGGAIADIDSNQDNKQVLVIVKASSLTKRYGRLLLTASANANVLGVFAIGLSPDGPTGAAADCGNLLQRLVV